MLPPVFTTLRADSDVTALIGNPPRVWRQGEAPQGVTEPYAVWFVVSGIPDNTLSETPAVDRCTVQLDAYATTDAASVSLATAIRDSLEPYAHMTAWRVLPRDEETRLFNISMDFDWWLGR